jgi:hypothetical protein
MPEIYPTFGWEILFALSLVSVDRLTVLHGNSHGNGDHSPIFDQLISLNVLGELFYLG